MGRSLSPILRRELENLDKDADSRRSAMKALKSYVKDLDTMAIPMFLAQVSETEQTGVSSGEHTISLYEVLARVHGPKIVPQVENIMNSIVKTLSSSAGAFALHQACSKVVPAIARYAIDPTTAEDKKRYLIHSLCKPLSDCLLGSQENLSSGAALCLQALVESDNWRFASNEMVNDVCQRVAGAMEKYPQTNSHMALITALAKHNSLIVEAYARLLIHSGLRTLDAGFMEANSQKQLSAIHMVTSLMRRLDPKSILSELDLVTKEMEKCQSDRLPFVTGAAFEALQIAKRICAEKGSKSERDLGSVTGSNFDRRDNTRTKKACCSECQSPLTASPESQTFDSFLEYDYSVESPNSTNQGLRGTNYDRKNVNRKLWQRSENGGVDVSLKDGIFSDMTQGSDVMSSDCNNFSDDGRDYFKSFEGFMQGSQRNEVVRSNTPSPQRSNSRININDVKIFSTPRKLIRSLQDLDDSNSDFSKKQSRRIRSPTVSTFPWTPTRMHKRHDISEDKNLSGGKLIHSSSGSVSSIEDISNRGLESSVEGAPANKSQFHSNNVQKNHKESNRVIVCALFVLLATIFCLLSIDGQNDKFILVPT